MKSIIIAVFWLLQSAMLMLPQADVQKVSIGLTEDLFLQEVNKTEEPGRSFHLPASLEYIGSEVFEGTALADTVGDSEPVMVWIPASVSYIGDNAFPRTDSIQIVSAKGSYAQRWAKEHGYRFIEERIASAPDSLNLKISRSIMCLGFLFAFLPINPEKYRKTAYPVFDRIGRDPKNWPGMRVLELDYP